MATMIQDQAATIDDPRSPRAARRSAAPACERRYFRWKMPLERVCAAILLIPGVLLIGLLALLIRATSRGPGIYRQLRVGRSGRNFTMYKIRTMVHNAEAGTGPTWATSNDPRLTRLGYVVRKLHLDELPQLWNVVRGEMSLVGPRPERPEFTHWLATEIPDYLERLTVRPGITGLAQINLPPDTDLESVRRKLLLDLEYIRSAGPWLDLRMLACTAFRMIGLRGEIAMRLCWVKRIVKLPARDDIARVHDPAKPGGNGTAKKAGLNGHASLAMEPAAAPRHPK
jgi:lipopolysaccharide/colanic/teichoic acid biosynthesis glycosyltransferase